MEDIKKFDGIKFEQLKGSYSYLYDLGNAMFAYYDSNGILSQDQVQLIVDSSDDDKIYGMYLAACDRQKIRYNYSTFSKNTDAINVAKIMKKRKK